MKEKEILSWVRDLTPIGRVCLTGGEPTTQDLHKLIEYLRQSEYIVHMETNGTLCPSWVEKVDWLSVSPKMPSRQVVQVEPDPDVLAMADEIKVVVDAPDALEWAKQFEKRYHDVHLFVQPEGMRVEMIDLCVQFVKDNPRWRISPQLHRLLKVR